MKILKLLLATYAAIYNASYGFDNYDNELLFLYSKERPSYSLLEKRVKSTSDNVDLDIRMLEMWYRSPDVPITRNMSTKSIWGRDVIGHFFVHDLNKDYEPFTNLFGSEKPDASGSGNHLPMWLQFIKLSGCEVLDLFDAKLSCQDFSKLSNLTKLKFIGMPNRGMNFDCEFFLPENLEFLVVRNCVLNDNFFKALGGLTNLKKLVILGCTLKYPSPKASGWIYDDHSWDGLPKLFTKVNLTLDSVKIHKSDPDIFNYMLSKKWPKLTHLDVFITSYNKSALTYLAQDPNKRNFHFPILSQVSAYSIIHDHSDLKKAFPEVVINSTN
jgi:hypothetical protein